jgi:glyoxylase-like metal-dependent hydrolase (beta-lactamase superfamily II)
MRFQSPMCKDDLVGGRKEAAMEISNRSIGRGRRGWVVALALILMVPAGAKGQEESAGQDWRGPLSEGQAALAEGDAARAVPLLRAAAEAIPPGHLTRPWIQYHLARASALTGDPQGAVDWLTVMWDEDIEGLMLSMSNHDPAFEGVREVRSYRELLSQVESMDLQEKPLGQGTFLLEGAGSGVLVVIREGEALMVDTGYDLAAPAVTRAVEALGAARIALVVNTHGHEDHVGGNGLLGPQAPVVAHSRTRDLLAEGSDFTDGVRIPGRAGPSLPGRVVEGPDSLDFNGWTVRLRPAPAHTGGDLMVHIPEAGVLHMGDLYLGANPFFFPGSDDPVAYLDTMGEYLSGLPASTTVVSGHDPPVPVLVVLDQLEDTRQAMQWVATRVEEGATLGDLLGESGERGYPPAWVTFFHRALGGEGG